MFRLKIVTPKKIFFEEDVEMVIFKTTVGDRAIMKGHIPTVAGIKDCTLKVKQNGSFKEATIGKGLVTVDSKTETVLLTENASWNE